jgi:hypothetical protein
MIFMSTILKATDYVSVEIVGGDDHAYRRRDSFFAKASGSK